MRLDAKVAPALKRNIKLVIAGGALSTLVLAGCDLSQPGIDAGQVGQVAQAEKPADALDLRSGIRGNHNETFLMIPDYA